MLLKDDFVNCGQGFLEKVMAQQFPPSICISLAVREQTVCLTVFCLP